MRKRNLQEHIIDIGQYVLVGVVVLGLLFGCAAFINNDVKRDNYSCITITYVNGDEITYYNVDGLTAYDEPFNFTYETGNGREHIIIPYTNVSYARLWKSKVVYLRSVDFKDLTTKYNNLVREHVALQKKFVELQSSKEEHQ